MKKNTKNKNRLLAAVAVGSLAVPVLANAQYDFQDISYPGQPDTQVFGINDSGDAVGTGFGATAIPFVYSSMDGTHTPVPPADGYASTSVLGINDAGDMAGSVTSLDLTTTSAFIRSKKGTYTVFSHPDAISSTTARAINNKGLVTGTRDTVDGSLAGFLYDPRTETFTDLVPSLLTIAQGISSKGDVVGDARFEVDPCGGATPLGRYGWVREKDGTVILFQVNGQRTAARGINDAGKVVGFTTDPFTGQTKGFVIDAPDTNCEAVAVDASDLFAFPGSDFTFPEGITNSGDIVGLYQDAVNGFGFIATRQ